MAKKYYVDKKDLVAQWCRWNDSGDSKAWDALAEYVYKICLGVAVYFCPKNEEERVDLAHHTFTLTMVKIKTGKLVYTPGRGSFFGLLTTAAMRHLYSAKKKASRQKHHLEKFRVEKFNRDGLTIPDHWSHH